MRRAARILLAATLLCGGLGGCGGSSAVKSASRAPGRRAVPPGGDGDPDDAVKRGGSRFDKDDRWLVDVGRKATPLEERKIQGLLVRYYYAAASADGHAACPLVYSLTAETVAEEHGQLPGPSGLSAGACASGLSQTFAHAHSLYAHKGGTLRMVRARVDGAGGVAFVDFAGGPIRMMPVHLEGGAWKVREVVDLALG